MRRPELLMRFPRAVRWACWAVGALLLLMVLAWLALPPWLKHIAEEKGSAALGRAVTIGAVHVNPLRLSVAVDELVIAGPAAGAPPLLRLAYGEVNADIRSLWRRAPVVEGVELRSPVVQLARTADGRYDIDDIVARLSTKEPTAPDADPPRFAVYNLRLSGGELQFDDRPRQRVHHLRSVELGLPFLSNMEDAVDVNVEPHLAFQLDDTAFDTGAQAKPFTHDRSGALMLKTGDIDLADWLPYLPGDLPVRPVGGELAVDLTLQFKAPAGAAPELGLKGTVRAKKLRMVDAGNATLAELAGLSVALADVQPLRRQVALGAVTLDGLSLQAGRDDAGKLNWLKALRAPKEPVAAPAAAASSSPVSAPEKPWQLSLAKLSLKNSRVQWEDQAVRPAMHAAIEALQLELEGLRWPVTGTAAPARLHAQGQLANVDARVDARPNAPAPRRKAAVPPPAPLTPDWQLDGEWSATGGQVQAHAAAWPLAWAGPYLAPLLKPRLEGSLGFDATARWNGAPGEQTPTVQIASLHVDELKATEAGQKAAAAAWKKLLVSDAELDLAQRKLVLGRISLDQPALRAQRSAQGQIDLLQWASTTSESSAASEAAPAWQVQLRELTIDGGRVAWHDAALAKAEPVALELQRLNLQLRDLQWPAAPKASSSLSGDAQVMAGGGAGTAGKLKWQGQLGLQPAGWRGRLSIERFPIHSVVAYAGEALPVTVARAEAGWAGDVAVTVLPEGLSLAMKGDARLTDLSVYAPDSAASARGDELLRWNALELAGLQVAMDPGKPPRVVVGEGRLTDFYAQLMVTEAGRFNLTQLGDPAPAAPGDAASAVPVAASSPVAASAASAPVPAQAAPAMELSVGGVLLKNGRIDFSDHFVRPNYSAALSDLSGKLGAFRTGTREMATLELRGRVAGTAQLEVRGSLNPMAKPLAMDIQARASDLELAPLSPYAGKYAGYAIERGKLTMDVSYRIDADGRLDAKNQLVLNQLTFGERIDSPDATKLPVLLAVALLKDRNGVIDLNLPIGGSLNDPQFSIGGLVIKLIVNLLTKALTAPFALLAGGGSDELSFVEFRPGTARLADSAPSVIDKVAKALTDRPSLQMTVNGSADPQSEREAIQAAWLDERLVAERRKELLRSGGAGDATNAPPSSPSSWPAEERLRLLKRVYADTKLPNKPRNVLGLAKDISGPEMEALLRASYVVNVDNARELALQRGLAVRDALIAKGLPSDRLFLAAPKLRASGEDDAHWTPRVQLSLGTP